MRVSACLGAGVGVDVRGYVGAGGCAGVWARNRVCVFFCDLCILYLFSF